MRKKRSKLELIVGWIILCLPTFWIILYKLDLHEHFLEILISLVLFFA